MDRKLVKVSKDKFALETYDKDNDLKTVKGYKRKELRTIYEQLQVQYEQLKRTYSADKKKLEAIDVEDNDELRALLTKMEMATKLEEKAKLEESTKKQNADLLMFLGQMKEIASAIPEVKRK